LDSFHDRRSGYWYTVTAAGVQAEGTIANEKEFTADWDAVWQSAVARSDSGWSCEIRIPFQSIRHGGAREDGWGIGFARYIERRAERTFWPPVDPQKDFYLSQVGTLYGLKNIASPAHIEVLPHAVGRWDAEANDGEWHSENEYENLGFYLKAVPSAAMTLDFAYEPDFAQVDVDAQEINLSDYPIFLSEKRPFFLENKQLFEELPYYLFYTRRITDPDYAGRLNLQKGRVRASIIAGKNRRPDDILQDAAAGRVVLNLGRVHRIGVTSTMLHQEHYTATAAALDARFRWRTQDRLLLWFSGVNREDTTPLSEGRTCMPQDDPYESRIAFLRDWEFVEHDIAVTYRGTDYDVNDLGYTDYSNVLRYSTWFGQSYYPRNSFLRLIYFDVNAYTEAFTDNSHRDGEASFDIAGTTTSNWNGGMGFEWDDRFRRSYTSDGEFRDNFYRQYGRFNTEYYRGWYHWTWLNSDTRKPVEYHHDLYYAAYRGGKAFAYDPRITWKPRANLQFSEELSWRRLWGVKDFEDGDYQLWISNIRWSPCLNLSLRATVQYAQRLEWIERAIQTNLLLAWNWNPGSWFYLVYDETGRMLREDLPNGYCRDRTLTESRPGDRTLRAKLTYFFTVP
ncbi:hypothetical protein KKH18_12245, partial [bacterium]|nr:hypothetical protein [bacterium]